MKHNKRHYYFKYTQPFKRLLSIYVFAHHSGIDLIKNAVQFCEKILQIKICFLV